eukprot:3995971-Pleurochrysis_carterae.AAC.2
MPPCRTWIVEASHSQRLTEGETVILGANVSRCAKSAVTSKLRRDIRKARAVLERELHNLKASVSIPVVPFPVPSPLLSSDHGRSQLCKHVLLPLAWALAAAAEQCDVLECLDRPLSVSGPLRL